MFSLSPPRMGEEGVEFSQGHGGGDVENYDEGGGVARYFNRRPWTIDRPRINGVDVAEKYSVPLRIRTISNRSATRGRRTLGVTDSRQTRGNFAVAEPPLRAPRLIDRFLWGCGPPISRIYLPPALCSTRTSTSRLKFVADRAR